MALPELTKKKAEKSLIKFCEDRVPAQVRNQVRLSHSFRGDTVTLVEDRVVWNDATKWTHSPVAQFRFNEKKLSWSLYCRDRNQKWHAYQNIEPSNSFDKLLKEVDKDPTGIFWG